MHPYGISLLAASLVKFEPMKRSLTLSVPTPCSQQWGSFTQVPGGGFCSSCNKVVVDFTTLTDAQILDHFKHATGTTCGKFLPGQLKSYAFGEQVKVHPGLMLLKAGFLSLLFLTLARPASAQVSREKTKTELSGSFKMRQDSIAFRGVVTSAEDHSPVPGVNVILKGSAVGTVTDSDGRFEFPQPLKKGDVLVFAFIGLTSKEYQVDGKTDVGFEVPMQMCMSYELMGEVQAEGLYTEKRVGFWSRVKAVLTRAPKSPKGDLNSERGI